MHKRIALNPALAPFIAVAIFPVAATDAMPTKPAVAFIKAAPQGSMARSASAATPDPAHAACAES